MLCVLHRSGLAGDQYLGGDMCLHSSDNDWSLSSKTGSENRRRGYWRIHFWYGAQIFILPYVDTIVGFTILYVIVTAISAWIMTASPRISYLGVQIALAFYFIHLRRFRFETSLVAGRDRVVGVLLGLFAMWLIFDQLWGSPAGVDMRRSFIGSIRKLAQLAREPDVGDRKDAIRRAYALGQTINAGFDQTRALADGVLFEFGRSRSADLAFRERVKDWQPQAAGALSAARRGDPLSA